MRSRLVFALPFVILASVPACSSDDETAAPPVDAAADVTSDTLADVGADAPLDTATADTATADTATEDTATEDTATEDTASDAPADATADGASDAGADTSGDATDEAGDTGGACHAVTFGAPAATIQNVASLPTMTGGTIPAPAVFDAVDAQTTGSVTGTYRGTWSFRADGRIDSLDQITLGSGTPPVPVPRTFTYTAAGSTLTRTQVCGGGDDFSNQYRVRTSGADTFLEVRQGAVMFVFKRR